MKCPMDQLHHKVMRRPTLNPTKSGHTILNKLTINQMPLQMRDQLLEQPDPISCTQETYSAITIRNHIGCPLILYPNVFVIV
jgi:hypothetical protein